MTMLYLTGDVPNKSKQKKRTEAEGRCEDWTSCRTHHVHPGKSWKSSLRAMSMPGLIKEKKKNVGLFQNLLLRTEQKRHFKNCVVVWYYNYWVQTWKMYFSKTNFRRPRVGSPDYGSNYYMLLTWDSCEKEAWWSK